MKLRSWINICTPLLLQHHSKEPRCGNNLNVPSVGEWIKKMWYIHEMEYCCCSVTKSCLTLCEPMNCSAPAHPVPQHLLDFAQVHVHWIGDAIQPSHPLWPSSPPAFNLSQHQGLFNKLVLLIRWLKYWSFSISPSNEYSGLVSFRINPIDPLAVKGAFKSLLPHYSSKAPILWGSAFFMVQLSHPYMTTGMEYAMQRGILLTHKRWKSHHRWQHGWNLKTLC